MFGNIGAMTSTCTYNINTNDITSVFDVSLVKHFILRALNSHFRLFSVIMNTLLFCSIYAFPFHLWKHEGQLYLKSEILASTFISCSQTWHICRQNLFGALSLDKNCFFWYYLFLVNSSKVLVNSLPLTVNTFIDWLPMK